MVGHIFLTKFYSPNNYHTTIKYIFGLLILSNIFLIINFITSLNLLINTFIFLFPFLYLFNLKKKYKNKFIKNSIIFAIFVLLLISYDTVNRPDAGLYHLPFTSLLNENKIIFGSANLHFRFGHTSIIQYIDAGYFNYLFKDIGILIPRCLFLFSILSFFFSEISRNLKLGKNNFALISLLFFFQIAYDMNRYSYQGNDIPAHLIFLFNTYFFLKSKISNYKNFFLISLLIIFAFQLKSTLIMIFIIPLIYTVVFKRFTKFSLNLRNLIPLSLILFWLTKNIIVSGCLLFPLKESCFSQFRWNSSLIPSLHHNVEKVSEENEAWAKGWPDRENKKLNYKQYLNSDWIYTWFGNHGKNVLLKKLLPLFCLTIFFYIFITIRKKKIIGYKKSNKLILIKSLVIQSVFLLGSFVWFIKFPTYRYGSSFLIGSIIFLLPFIIIKNFYLKNFEKKIIFHFKILTVFLLLMKYVAKYDDNKQFLPNIYSFESKFYRPLEHKKNVKNRELFYYYTDGNLCMYSPSPCTNLIVSNKLNLDRILGYKIYYLDFK